MDVAEKNKAINRSKISAKTDKLKERVSTERYNLLKLNVSQDTAYWDLQQRADQVQRNHEKLQANMVELQMQHEALSSQYQNELRCRPEIHNKLNSTRQICDVLVNHSEKLRDTLARCKPDQAALCEAYEKSQQVVRGIKDKLVQDEEKNRQLISNLEEKVKLTTDHNTQLMHFFSAEKQRADTELVNLKSKFEAMVLKKDELMTSRSELERLLDQHRGEIKTKQNTILSLEKNMKQLVQHFTLEGKEVEDKLVKQEKQLKEADAAIESLKEGLANQEIFTKSVCDEADQLKEKIAVHLEELQDSKMAVKSLEVQLEESGKANTNLENQIAAVNEKNEALQKDLNEKIQLLADAEASLQVVQHQLSDKEAEKLEVSNQLTAAKEEAAAVTLRIQELIVESQRMEAGLDEMNSTLNECRINAEIKFQKLTTTIQSKDKELDSKASTVNQLMTEMKLAVDERNRTVADLKELLKQREMDIAAAKTLEKQIVKRTEVLESDVKSKDKELANQLNIIFELRSDKDRLRDKIGAMQSKMDNIQKELCVPPPPPGAARLAPEHDDNALMMMPEPRARKLPQSAAPTSQRPLAITHNPPQLYKEHSLDFNFFSDSTEDEQSRCFEALSRGEAQKRRSGGVPASHGAERNSAPLGHLPQERKFFKTNRGDKAKKAKQSAVK